MFAWATVTGTSPLRVRVDGDTAPLTVTPDTLVAVTTDDRVRVELAGRRVIIHGVAQ